MVKMRILFIGFLFVLGWFCAFPTCVAEDKADLGKLTLTSKWDPVEGLQSTLSFKADARWDWLDSRMTAVLRSPNDDQGYSGCDLGLTFPDLTNNLKFSTSFRWNEDYRLFSSGFVYKISPWKNFTFNCGYVSGRRDAAPGRYNQYLYVSNRGSLELDYKPADLNYHLNYTYTDKSYPITQRYSSGQQNFSQKITWPLERGSRLILGYDETTGDYPYDLNYSSSFWKAAWTFQGEHQLNRDFHWKWEYDQMEMDQSRERKRRSQQLKQKMTWQFNPSSQLSAELSLAEKIYTSEIVYDPGEINSDLFEDPNSRIGRKITIQYRREWERVSMELGVYGEWRDYYLGSENDVFFTGFHGTLFFDVKDWRFTFKVVSLGDLRGGLPYYQFRFEYIPQLFVNHEIHD
jgi:hypothetical protein